MVKANIDDGSNPELVNGAKFDGTLEIPVICNNRKITLPESLIPFSAAKSIDLNGKGVIFYEKDTNFADLLIHPDRYLDLLKTANLVASPDNSVYRDAPLTVQLGNIYKNRALGSYFQRNGVKVIPNIRWGDERTFTNMVFSEPPAFLGVEKYGTVIIGTYGCSRYVEDKNYLRQGLLAMLNYLEPEQVIVYGGMPKEVFGDLMGSVHLVHYEDYTSYRLRGSKDGHRM